MTENACESNPSPASGWLDTWMSMAGNANPTAVWISQIVIILFAAGMFIATWAAWPSLIVDCGREMYVPAAMVQGKRLYRDVWYTYGPLAPSVNALLFYVFGVSLNTLYGGGLTVFVGSALVLHSIALRFVPPIAALVCALGFLATGFHSGIFNYILPYTCAATFGALLCLLTLLFLLRYLEYRGGPNLVFAGVFAGLALLAKFEFFLPCAAGLVAAVLLLNKRVPGHLPPIRSVIVPLLPGLALAGGIYGWFLYRYGLEFLIHTNWQTAPGSYFMQRYGPWWLRQSGMRLDLGETVKLIIHALIAISVWLVFGLLLETRRWLAIAAGVLLIAFLGSSYGTRLPVLNHPIFGEITIARLARALPGDMVYPQGMFLVVLLFGGFLIARAMLRRQPLPAAPLVTIVMGLMLAVRVAMEIHPTGLAIYSSSILFISFIFILWRIVNRGQNISVAAYFATYAIVFAGTAGALYQEQGWPWQLIRSPLGDVRRTPDNVALVTQFLPVLQQAKSKAERVLLLPEITGLYFISGMQSPSRYEVFAPGILEPGKYTQIFLRELEHNQPDLIILSNRRTSEYGVDYFGLDYDREVLEWIESRYRVTGEIGHFERRAEAPLAALVYTPKN